MANPVNSTAHDMTYVNRIKRVQTLTYQGLNPRQIAEKLGYSIGRAKADVALVRSQVRDIDNLEAHLKDVIGRTGEELERLQTQHATMWELFEHASEMIVEMTPTEFGMQATPEIDPETGEAIYILDEAGNRAQYIDDKGKPRFRKKLRMAARDMKLALKIQGEINKLGQRRSELLKIIGPKIDISVQLAMQERTQQIVLDTLQSLEPVVYARVYRQLQLAQQNVALDVKEALPKSSREEIIEGSWRSVPQAPKAVEEIYGYLALNEGKE